MSDSIKDYPLELEALDSNGEKVSIPLFVPCGSCDSAGKQEAPEEPCPLCGHHVVKDPNCRACHGHGFLAKRQILCPDCGGDGRVVHQPNARLIADALSAIKYPGHPTEMRRFWG